MRAKLWEVNGAGLLFNVSFLMLALLVPLDAIHLRYAPWMIGILAAMPGVVQLPSRVMSGPLTVYLGERRLLIVTFALGATAGLLAAGITGQFVGLVLAQLAIGMARGLFWPAAQSLVSKLGTDPSQNLGTFISATKGGSLVGIAMSGMMARLLGIPQAFALSGGLSLVAVFLAWSFPIPAKSAENAHFGEAVKAMGPVGKSPVVVVSGLVALLTALPQALAQSFYPVRLLGLHVVPEVATVLTALQSLGMIGAGLVAAKMIRRWGFKIIILGAVMLLGLSVTLSSTGSVKLLAGCLVLTGIAAGLLNVGFLSAVTVFGERTQRGLYYSVTQAYFVLAMMGTPLISGVLASHASLSVMFMVDGLFTFAVGVIILSLWSWGFRQARSA